MDLVTTAAHSPSQTGVNALMYPPYEESLSPYSLFPIRSRLRGSRFWS
jgi:hypothetical protein